MKEEIQITESDFIENLFNFDEHNEFIEFQTEPVNNLTKQFLITSMYEQRVQRILKEISSVLKQRQLKFEEVFNQYIVNFETSMGSLECLKIDYIFNEFKEIIFDDIDMICLSNKYYVNDNKTFLDVNKLCEDLIENNSPQDIVFYNANLQTRSENNKTIIKSYKESLMNEGNFIEYKQIAEKVKKQDNSELSNESILNKMDSSDQERALLKDCLEFRNSDKKSIHDENYEQSTHFYSRKCQQTESKSLKIFLK